jgi:hypothetical protein
VAKQLPRVNFKEVWVVGLHGEAKDEYVDGVTQFDLHGRNSPICLVRIAPDFCSWQVERLQ